MDFIKGIEKEMNYTLTENGAIAYKSTLDKVVDLFAQISAMRGRSPLDKIDLFSDAYVQDKELAIKILFYSRDCRGGQGERQTFRDIYQFLIKNDLDIAIANIPNIIEYGRADDLIDIMIRSKNEKFINSSVKFISNVLKQDLINLEKNDNISLIGKWLPSINTSSREVVKKGKFLCEKLNMTNKQYRQTLSKLRKKIGIVETKMSNKSYNEIDYSTVPSLAMTKYKEAFKRNDVRFEEYLNDVKDGKATIKANTLYPYDIIRSYSSSDEENVVLEEQWKSLPDYLNGRECKMLTVCDMSASMEGLPMEVAISLGIYISDRVKGAYANKFITFSESPNFVYLNPMLSLKEKIKKVYNSDWGYSTDLESVFDLILDVALRNNLNQEDLPEQIIVITDMEFNEGCYSDKSKNSLMYSIKNKFLEHRYKLPKLVWWNVNAREEVFPMTSDEYCVYVSGCSPTIMKSIIDGKELSAIDLIKSTVLTERYNKIVF